MSYQKGDGGGVISEFTEFSRKVKNRVTHYFLCKDFTRQILPVF